MKQLLDEELIKIDWGKTEPINLYEPIAYSMKMGGKRTRPLLVLMGCELFGGDIQTAIKPALAVEIFHNFTLLHDDIMDNAPLRRNQPTVFQKWDANTAILSGDAMMIMAYQYLSACPQNMLSQILSLFNKTALEVCEGQQMDMDFENRDSVSIPEYLKMIEYKTAVLLACSLKIGALIGGSAEENATALYRFGKHIGIAFQLQDDMLDAFGDPEKVGKQVGGDIIANKKTYLLISALEKADDNQTQELQNLMREKLPSDEKVKGILRIFNALNIREAVEEEMKKQYQLAMQAMDSIDVPVDKKQPLITFAEKLMVREG